MRQIKGAKDQDLRDFEDFRIDLDRDLSDLKDFRIDLDRDLSD